MKAAREAWLVNPTATATPALVQHGTASFGASPQTVAFGANTTAGNLLLVYTNHSQSVNLPDTVTDTQGNTYTQATFGIQSGIGYQAIYWAIARSTSANSITVHCPAGTTDIAYIAQEVSGIAASPVDVVATPFTPSGSGVAQGNGISGLAGASDYVAYWALYEPPNSTPVGGVWSSDLSCTIGGGNYFCLAYTVGGPSVTGPVFAGGGTTSACCIVGCSFKAA